MSVDVSVIIVNYNTQDLLKECLFSIKKNISGVSYEIIVVDNASKDGSVAMVKLLFPDIILIENTTNKGFGSANNSGVKASKGRYIFLFNSDAILLTDTVTSLFLFLEKHRSFAMAGPRVLLPDMTRQPKICGELPSIIRIINDTLFLSNTFPHTPLFNGMNTDVPLEKVSALGWISGVCMLIRADIFERVGGFDNNIFLYCEDMDLCHRIKLDGWDIAHIDDYQIVHKCGGSVKSKEDLIRNSVLQQKYFFRMIESMFSPLKMVLVRWIILNGLFFRAIAGAVIDKIRPDNKNLLLETSVARIKNFFHSKSIN